MYASVRTTPHSESFVIQCATSSHMNGGSRCFCSGKRGGCDHFRSTRTAPASASAWYASRYRLLVRRETAPLRTPIVASRPPDPPCDLQAIHRAICRCIPGAAQGTAVRKGQRPATIPAQRNALGNRRHTDSRAKGPPYRGETPHRKLQVISNPGRCPGLVWFRTVGAPCSAPYIHFRRGERRPAAARDATAAGLFIFDPLGVWSTQAGHGLRVRPDLGGSVSGRSMGWPGGSRSCCCGWQHARC
jgi:hypothetical protein